MARWLVWGFRVTGCAHAGTALPLAAAPTSEPGPQAVARRFVMQLAAGQFAAATEPFDDAMRKALSPEKLAGVWHGVEAAHGPFQTIDRIDLERVDEGWAALATCRFERSNATFELFLDPAQRLSGFWTTPARLLARRLVAQLARGEFEAAAARFTPDMRAAAPPDKLGAIWHQLEAQLGPFQRILEVKLEPLLGSYWAARVRAAFGSKVVVLQVVVDGDARISAFTIRPDAGAWKPPPYAEPARFTSRAVKVGSAPALPGHLLIPIGAGPFPAVVLVHGSGPNDENETIGPNEVFADLAEGLASRGVAVLRYDKRTRVSSEGVHTVREEYFESVAAALALLRAEPKIDPRRLVVLGHSEGAYLAPWIARENPGLAGVVMLAAPARPLLDLLIEQHGYLRGLHPELARSSKGDIEELERQKRRLDSGELQPGEEVSHLKGEYLLALKDYDPVAVAAKLTLPMLLLQGGRDFQVSPEHDFALFQRALVGRANTTLHLYPDLNHLFIAGSGKGTPDEYFVGGHHVALEVVRDVAAWVGRLVPASS
ncbi:MAG: alpha/beta hydrolase [Myxococcales bacterium]